MQDRVQVQFPDGAWYAGSVVGVTPDEADVRFGDGQVRRVPLSATRLLGRRMPVGAIAGWAVLALVVFSVGGIAAAIGWDANPEEHAGRILGAWWAALAIGAGLGWVSAQSRVRLAVGLGLSLVIGASYVALSVFLSSHPGPPTKLTPDDRAPMQVVERNGRRVLEHRTGFRIAYHPDLSETAAVALRAGPAMGVPLGQIGPDASAVLRVAGKDSPPTVMVVALIGAPRFFVNSNVDPLEQQFLDQMGNRESISNVRTSTDFDYDTPHVRIGASIHGRPIRTDLYGQCLGPTLRKRCRWIMVQLIPSSDPELAALLDTVEILPERANSF